MPYVASIYYWRYLTHGSFRINKLGMKYFPIQKELNKDSYIIICGDFGCVWDGSKCDNYWLDWLEDKNFTTLFVAGNHENYNLLRSYPTEKWNGGIVRKIRPSVIMLENGEIFNINNKSYFVMGGATSIDKAYRKEGKSWWSQEIPSRAEFERAATNLEAYNMKVDFILSHCAPNSVIDRIDRFYPQYDTLTNFFEKYIMKYITFSQWFCAHYHLDRSLNDINFHILYNDFIEIMPDGTLERVIKL